jgi:hypothetical protein
MSATNVGSSREQVFKENRLLGAENINLRSRLEAAEALAGELAGRLKHRRGLLKEPPFEQTRREREALARYHAAIVAH